MTGSMVQRRTDITSEDGKLKDTREARERELKPQLPNQRSSAGRRSSQFRRHSSWTERQDAWPLLFRPLWKVGGKIPPVAKSMGP